MRIGGVGFKAIIKAGHTGFPGHRGVPCNAATGTAVASLSSGHPAEERHKVADHADADVCHSAAATSSSTQLMRPPSSELLEALGPKALKLASKCKDPPAPPSCLPSTKRKLPIAAIDEDDAKLRQQLLSDMHAELCEVKVQRDDAEARCRQFQKRCHAEMQAKDREVARVIGALLNAEERLARSKRKRAALESALESTHRRLRGD